MHRGDQAADDRRCVAVIAPVRVRAQPFEAHHALRPAREMLAVDVREDPCKRRDLRRRLDQLIALLEPLSDLLRIIAVIGPCLFEKRIELHW